jgi:RimJ/RimL family protein N-acetyltransferase
MISLGALKREDMPQLLAWRNMFPEAWRDPRPTTITQQYDWFDNIVSKSSEGRYWGVYSDGVFVGQVELTSIIWEYGIAEIGLIVDPNLRGLGIGRLAVWLALKQGFEYLRLDTICGECYLCNKAHTFWSRLAKEWGGTQRVLRRRKRWDGKLWDSVYFDWAKEELTCGD